LAAVILGRAPRAVNHMERKAAVRDWQRQGIPGLSAGLPPRRRGDRRQKIAIWPWAIVFRLYCYLAPTDAPRVADVKGAWMAHPIEIILTRQLAEYLSVPLLLVDPKGDLLFYNEPAESILGCRFEDTGGMPAEQWPKSFTALDEQGHAIASSDLPVMVTLATRMPAHQRLQIVDGEQRARAIEVTSIPIAGLHGDFLGAAAMFWVLPE
jgi:PAS domain